MFIKSICCSKITCSTQVVPRLEAEYLNPSPWAEREAYEKEFNDIMNQIGKHVGTDQFLTCLLIMANLFSLPPDVSVFLNKAEEDAIAQTRKQVSKNTKVKSKQR